MLTSFQSKGGILAKTCDYIIDLQTSNQRFAENAKEYERMQLDYEVVRLQVRCLVLLSICYSQKPC